MAIVVTELQDSRQVGLQSAMKHFEVVGTSDELLARQAVETLIGGWQATFDDKALANVQVTPLEIDTAAGTGRWSATVTYSTGGFQPPAFESDTDLLLCTSIEDEISGENRRVFASRRTISKAVPAGGAAAIDFGGALNVQGEGAHMKVEGIDMPFLKKNILIARTYKVSYITPAKIAQWDALFGKVNNAALEIRINNQLYSYPDHTMKFLGHTKRLVEGLKRVPVVHRFEYRAGNTDMIIGSGGSGTAIYPGIVRGWDYVWTRYVTRVAASEYTMKLVQANVEEVCEDASFSVLDLY
ncbi:MAG: hypothetical protein IMZ55_06420 [Acidobacteria bacterium]|nr:hypothetical protein [Acidobacteriota bacterium]